VEKLPRDLSVIFMMREVEGMSTAETADCLDLTEVSEGPAARARSCSANIRTDRGGNGRGISVSGRSMRPNGVSRNGENRVAQKVALHEFKWFIPGRQRTAKPRECLHYVPPFSRNNRTSDQRATANSFPFRFDALAAPPTRGKMRLACCSSPLLVNKQPNSIVVDVGGVGYEVTIPLSTFYNWASFVRSDVEDSHSRS
jgi:hypothetical protein